ncbi:MAG: DUF1295 domain-containing protein [Chitinophagaceae bacterium]|nr:DUF1295 domain-containing protein [Chitinophagaceae bacterium]
MNIYIKLGLVLMIYVSICFAISIILKRNDIADIAWGLGFCLISWSAFILSNFSPVSLLVNILVTIWGLRLALHIYNRNKGKPEDFRYLNWRNQWKNFYVRSFLQVFLLQGIFLYIIAFSIFFINVNAAQEINVLTIIGVAVWLFGFAFEGIADHQLKIFKSDSNNKGKIITSGLWKYSRHPNYFGEVVLWWGIFIIALGIENGIYTIISPLLITYLIVFVSGIPMLEEKYRNNQEFQAYKKRTSAFFPLPPKI